MREKPSNGYPRFVVKQAISKVGLRGWHLHVTSMSSVALCVTLWIRAKTVDQDERGNAERRALFVGLWAPTLWLVGDTVERERPRRRLLG